MEVVPLVIIVQAGGMVIVLGYHPVRPLSLNVLHELRAKWVKCEAQVVR